ncbi:hypothetical protein SPRG_06098 [Saprolegnia parasitica CBS 223.65]|uniref:CCT domain-containing protein n=1 Tax=Saprolegnia parasitica (strain CBS 223.65) TaxID=695850 RepID=A0A067CEV7_SAPPC|nr:hypothetical protein SPRG_06098 [Saprolegnia parasitica CBS 223.65]KDO29043.1 hypothetical protein SPRG_06098 [Saprolegnia parasitica CBS 223.65]|eukprot:XP_012200213.1 hypothetical protein SPRG_06098 [Saprolegnia parasitica CBS 223.65]
MSSSPPAKLSIGVPPARPLSESIAIKKEPEDASMRKDSMGWISDDFMGMINHTPPAFSPGSLTLPSTKRNRSGSISGRLLSASDLEEKGFIDRYQKGVLKDLIISGDEKLQKALETFEQGDPTALEALLDSGALNRKTSVDLLDDLDLGFLNVGSLGDTPKEEYTARQTLDEWDEIGFEPFSEITSRDLLEAGDFYSSSLGNSLPNSLPSMGMGITPPNAFSFADDFLDQSSKLSSPTSSENVKAEDGSAGMSTSRPIGIPGSAATQPRLGASAFIGGMVGLGGGLNDSEKKAFVGAYSPESRRKRVEKFLDKRQKRVWRKEVKYDVRKNFADSRLRVKGRFVKKEDEQLLRELLSFT